MSRLRQRMLEDMQLRGFAEKTQDAYLRGVRQLADHFGKSPEENSEEELRQYFLYFKEREEGLPERVQPGAVCDQVSVRADVEAGLANLQGCAPAQRKETAGGIEPGRGAAGAGLPAELPALRVSHDDLLMRSADRRGGEAGGGRPGW